MHSNVSSGENLVTSVLLFPLIAMADLQTLDLLDFHGSCYCILLLINNGSGWSFGKNDEKGFCY